MKSLSLFAKSLVLVAGTSLSLHAGECADIAGRSDLLFCDDFESGTWSRWPEKPARPTRMRVTEAYPFMGKYSMQLSYDELEEPGWINMNFSPSEEIRIRFYVFFDSLYHWGAGYTDHMFGLRTTGGTTCSGNPGALDFGPWGPLVYRTGSCNGTRFEDLKANMGTPEQRMPRNGKWTRIEMHVKFNTIGGCTDRNGNGVIDSKGECDGVYAIWMDDVQVVGYYDLNFRGNDNPDMRMNSGAMNHYYRTGGQTFNGRIFNEYRDNLVILRGGNGGQVIGPPAGAPTNLGKPDMLSPYQTIHYKEWFGFNASGTRIRPGADCEFARMGDPDRYHNIGAFSYVNAPAHNTNAGPCKTQFPNDDRSLKLTTSSARQYAGAGGDYTGNGALPAKGHVANGWMLLDSTSFPAPNGAALSGFVYYRNETARNYMALGVDPSNHPVLVKQFSNSAAPEVVTTNTSVTLPVNRWFQFEVRGSEDHHWSVLLDGREILKATNVADSPLWSYNGGNGVVTFWGISDHMNNTRPLTVFVDDLSNGSTSFQDCFGWNPEICPFSGTTAAATHPSRAAAASALEAQVLPGRTVQFDITLASRGDYVLQVSDLQGRVIWERSGAAAAAKVPWDGKAPDGVYICRLLSGGASTVRKFTLTGT